MARKQTYNIYDWILDKSDSDDCCNPLNLFAFLVGTYVIHTLKCHLNSNHIIHIDNKCLFRKCVSVNVCYLCVYNNTVSLCCIIVWHQENQFSASKTSECEYGSLICKNSSGKYNSTTVAHLLTSVLCEHLCSVCM